MLMFCIKSTYRKKTLTWWLFQKKLATNLIQPVAVRGHSLSQFSSSSSRHLKFLTPAPTPTFKSFWLRMKNTLVDFKPKKLVLFVHSLAPQTRAVEPESKFQNKRFRYYVSEITLFQLSVTDTVPQLPRYCNRMCPFWVHGRRKDFFHGRGNSWFFLGYPKIFFQEELCPLETKKITLTEKLICKCQISKCRG